MNGDVLLLVTKFRVVQLRLVSFDEQVLIGQDSGMVIGTLYFKKGCHFELSFSTSMNMLMNTLREVLSINGTTIIPTSLPNRAFRLTDVVFSTCTTGESVYEITSITSEMMAYFKLMI